nr:GDP-L-fucose:beta-D-galactoside alpha-2-L-fucosyltransferase homolog {internal fragment, isolate HP 94266} [swine, submaxillary glands, Peptide Partial, 12 aa] [Sus scrofa]
LGNQMGEYATLY